MRFTSLVTVGTSLVALCAPSVATNAQTALPEILIEGARSPTEPSAPLAPPAGGFAVFDRAFQPVTVVERDEIDRNGGRTLGDQLFSTPGVTGSGLVPGVASRPIIRGLDNARVRIQENGVGAQDVSEIGEDHAVPIDPLAAQRIEVLRGPAALRFGGQAIGGVVNVVNDRIPVTLGSEGMTARSTTSVSSVDRGVEQSIAVDARSGRFAFHGDVFGRNAADYAIPGGRQANSWSQSRGFSLGGSYFFDTGFIGANVQHFTALYGIPGVESAENRTRIDMVQTKINTRGEHRPESGPFDAFRFWLGGSVYRHNEESLATPNTFGINATFRNEEIEGRVEATTRAADTALGSLSHVIGVQAGVSNLGTAGEAGGLIAPAQTRMGAAYLFSTLSFTSATRLQTAGRIEHVQVSGTQSIFPADLLGASGDPVESARRRAFTPMSASVALSQDLPFGFVGSVTAQYVERAPRALELFSRGPHEATGTFEIGNADLQKERAQTIELGLRRARGPWIVDAAAYYTRYSGFIYKRETGVRCDDAFSTCGSGSELAQIAYSQQDATFHGAELRSQFDLGEISGGVFGVEGQYDFVRARFADGTNAPRIPPHRLGGGVYWREANWFVRVHALHAFAQKEIAANETATPGYTLLNANVSYRRRLPDNPFGVKEITAGLAGTNLLNENIRNHVSFRKDEVLQPGRGVRAFLTARF